MDTDTDSAALADRWIQDGTAGRDPADDTPLFGPLPFRRSYAWLRARLAAGAAFLSARSTGWRAIAEDRSEADRLSRIDQNNQPRIVPLREMWVRSVRDHERFVTKLGPLVYRSAGIGAKRRYWFVVAVLVVTDIGMIVASNANGAGDALMWALLQGLGTGTSIMACGQLGALARERDEHAKRPDTPPTGFEQCAASFGAHAGTSDWVTNALGAGFGLLFFIQMAMRFAAGPIEGIGFASLAMMLLLGSAANAYTYGAADPIARHADQLVEHTSQVAATLERLEAPGATAAKLTCRSALVMRHHTDMGAAAGKVTLAEGAHTAASIAHPDVYGFYDHDHDHGNHTTDTDTVTDDPSAVDTSEVAGPDPIGGSSPSRNGSGGPRGDPSRLSLANSYGATDDDDPWEAA